MSTDFRRRDDHWFVATARAMVLSLLAVATSVVVVSGAFVAMHAHQFGKRDYISVTQCLVSRDGERAIALWWSVPTTLQGWTHRLTLHESGCGPSATLTWPDVNPACITAAATDDRIFVGAWDGSIYDVPGPTPRSKPRLVGRHNDGVLELEASADGRYLVSLSPTAMCAWNLATNQLQWQGCGGHIGCFCIRPDSSRLLCGMNDGNVIEFDLHTGERLRSLIANPPEWPVHDLDVSSDGQLISVTHSTGEVRILTGSAEHTSVPCPAPFCRVGWPRIARFSACGTMLASTVDGDQPDLAVWQVAGGERIATLHGHRGLVLGADFTADGRLFSWGQDATIRVWDVRSSQPLNVLSLAAPSEWFRGPRRIARPPAGTQASSAIPLVGEQRRG